MTTGNRTYGDKAVSQIATAWGVGNSFHYSKDWSGSDRPRYEKVVPVYRTVTRSYWVRPKKRWPGDKKPRPYVLVKRVYKIRLNKVNYSVPPYRQSLDHHGYNAVIRKRSQVPVSIEEGDDPTTGAHLAPTLVDSNVLEGGSGYLSGTIQTSEWTANDSIKLLDKLKTKLQGSDFNASVFLGEGHQTLRMIADVAIRLRKALTHLRRGDIAGTARSLLEGTSRRPLQPYSSMGSALKSTPQTIANNWLELQYGWLPLLDDAASGAELLAHQLSVPLEMRIRASRTIKFEGRRTYYIGRRTYGKSPLLTYFYQFSTSYYRKLETRRVTAFIKERPGAMAVLGLTDLAPVAWELTPWSFVADWFIPIGQYLNVRGLATLYKGKYFESSFYKGENTPITLWRNGNGANTLPNYHREAPTRAEWNPPGGRIQINGNRATSLFVSCSRGSLVDSPTIPLPTLKPLGKVASWAHCANAVALLVQQFGSSSTAGRTAVLPEIRRGR